MHSTNQSNLYITVTPHFVLFFLDDIKTSRGLRTKLSAMNRNVSV